MLDTSLYPVDWQTAQFTLGQRNHRTLTGQSTTLIRERDVIALRHYGDPIVVFAPDVLTIQPYFVSSATRDRLNAVLDLRGSIAMQRGEYVFTPASEHVNYVEIRHRWWFGADGANTPLSTLLAGLARWPDGVMTTVRRVPEPFDVLVRRVLDGYMVMVRLDGRTWSPLRQYVTLPPEDDPSLPGLLAELQVPAVWAPANGNRLAI